MSRQILGHTRSRKYCFENHSSAGLARFPLVCNSSRTRGGFNPSSNATLVASAPAIPRPSNRILHKSGFPIGPGHIIQNTIQNTLDLRTFVPPHPPENSRTYARTHTRTYARTHVLQQNVYGCARSLDFVDKLLTARSGRLA